MVVGYSSSYTSPGLVSMRDNSTAMFEVTKETVSTCYRFTPGKLSALVAAAQIIPTRLSPGVRIVFKQTCLARGSRNLEYSAGTRNSVIRIPGLSENRAKARRSVNQARLFSNVSPFRGCVSCLSITSRSRFPLSSEREERVGSRSFLRFAATFAGTDYFRLLPLPTFRVPRFAFRVPRGIATANSEDFRFQGMWIGSIMPLSALFGGIAGGPCIEYLGRRNTILGTALPFFAGKLPLTDLAIGGRDR